MGFRNNWVSTKWPSNKQDSAWIWNSGDFELTEFEVQLYILDTILCSELHVCISSVILLYIWRNDLQSFANQKKTNICTFWTQDRIAHLPITDSFFHHHLPLPVLQSFTLPHWTNHFTYPVFVLVQCKALVPGVLWRYARIPSSGHPIHEWYCLHHNSLPCHLKILHHTQHLRR